MLQIMRLYPAGWDTIYYSIKKDSLGTPVNLSALQPGVRSGLSIRSQPNPQRLILYYILEWILFKLISVVFSNTPPDTLKGFNTVKVLSAWISSRVSSFLPNELKT